MSEFDCPTCHSNKLDYERRIATLTAERDALQKKLAEFEGIDDYIQAQAKAFGNCLNELYALKRHYDAAAPEHNLLELFDLYDRCRGDGEQDAQDLLTALRQVAEAAKNNHICLWISNAGLPVHCNVCDALALPVVQAVLKHT